ncbi:MAG: 5'/3'-nucleotidase SurE [Desulfotomaculales bacterium]
MRLLLANDDGIFAEGLSILRRVMEEIAEAVYVVAPDRERSGAGHAITVHRPLRVREVEFQNEKSKGWVVDGTPADCVKLGLENLLDTRPDMVIAGINYGPNLGTDVLYSGTVSAAVEGIINDLPAIAVSLASHTPGADYSFAVAFVRELVPLVLEHGLPPGTLLNVNVPPGEPRGVKVTRLGNLRYVNVIDKRTDPRGRTYFWMAGEPLSPDSDDTDTDIGAVKQGYISITPVQIDLTNHCFIKELRKWPIKL